MYQSIIIILLTISIACSQTKNSHSLFNSSKKIKNNMSSLAERTQEIESDTSVNRLKKEIKKQSKVLTKALDTSRKLGLTYYLLGLKFLDYQMYGEALKYFTLAVNYYPEKPQLFYNIGISAGWIADAQTTEDEKSKYQEQAKTSLERTLKLEPNYKEALLSLAILYSSSFNLPYDANNLINRYHKLSKPSSISQFVEARIAVQLNDINRAIEIYTDISKTAPSPEERAIALRNRGEILTK